MSFLRAAFSRNKSNALSVGGSITNVLEVSAGTSGSQNAAQASRNLEAASKTLDEYVRKLDLDNEDNSDVISMSRWIEKAESYQNSFFDCEKFTVANLEPHIQEMADLAVVSSAIAYDRPEIEYLQPSKYELVKQMRKVPADKLYGSIKAATLGLYTHKLQSPDLKGKVVLQQSPIIVVSIRGTVKTSIRDWFVNLNDDLVEEAQGNAERATKVISSNVDSHAYGIHRGFMECARAMLDPIVAELQEMLSAFESDEHHLPQLLFTGHSAGGAVAALMYRYFMTSEDKLTGLSKPTRLRDCFESIHCITFGAPPVSSKPLPFYSKDSIWLSFINEGDPVARADKDYIDSLLRLWISPMPLTPTKWQLPAPLMWNAGRTLVVSSEQDEGGNSRQVLLEPGVAFFETIMGNPKRHKMDEYVQNLKLSFK